jgi:hypothetical protein
VVENCCVCEADIVIVAGLTLMELAGEHASDMAMALTTVGDDDEKLHIGALPEVVLSNDAAYRLTPPAAEIA